MDVFIHIGYPKTGSTAIQSHVFTNRRWFLDQNVYVPRSGWDSGFGHTHILGSGAHFIPPSGPQMHEKLRKELAEAVDAGYQRCLITSEALAVSREEDIRILWEALRGHRVTVLAYVREQGERFESASLQNAEVLFFTTSRAIFDPDNVLDYIPWDYDYHRVMCLWRHVFDDQLVIRTRVYDKSRFTEGNIVLDFLECLGLTPDASFCLQSTQVNISLDARGAALLVAVGKTSRDKAGLMKLSRALAAATAEAGAGARTYLTQTQRKKIWQYFQESNRRFYQEFRPENAQAGDDGFDEPIVNTDRDPDQSSVGWLRAVHRAIAEPALHLWQGNMLVSLQLSHVAREPNSGWRGAELDGIWSVGRQSELGFRLPEMASEGAPVAILLTIAGHYFGSNSSTRVVAGEQQETADLTRAEIRIELAADVNENGMRLLLEHQSPELPDQEQGDPAEKGVAFKLQFLSYDFIWE